MSTFTYIIRSINKENSTENANNCSIRLMGLPQQYTRFKASVVGFYVSTNGLGIGKSTISGQVYKDSTELLLNSVYELRADALISGGISDTNRTYSTVAFATNNNCYPQWEHNFEMDNVNGRSVRFQLYDEFNTLLKTSQTPLLTTKTDYSQNWVLVLNLQGIEQSPHKAI